VDRKTQLIAFVGAAVLALAGSSACARSLSALALDAAGAEAGDPVDRWAALIDEAAARFGVSQAWIRAVMRAESGGRAERDGRPITSSAGAIGLMQVMPATYAYLQRRYGLGADPADPRDNIMAGAAYIRELFDRYGYPDLFAAYNAGPLRLEALRAEGRALPSETLAYLSTIQTTVAQHGDQQAAQQSAGLFFPLGARSFVATPASRSAVRQQNGLFVALGSIFGGD
jgi:soluble lytic murein transglycosylase-like protein